MTQTDFFALAQDNITGMAQRAEAQKRAAEDAERLRQQERAAKEAERVAEFIFNNPHRPHDVLPGAASHAFYRDMARLLKPHEIKVVWVIEERDGGPRSSNYYAYKGEFGQIERHLKKALGRYCNEHCETF